MNDSNPLSSTDTEITLRCNRCGKPITPSEAVLTPTGYRCKECVRNQQKTFDTTKPLDIFLAFGIAAVIAFLGSWLTTYIGFFTLFLAPAVGSLIATMVRMAVQKRRSKTLFRATLIGSILGCLPLVFIYLARFLVLIGGGQLNISLLLPLAWRVLFAFLCSTSAYYQLSGIRLRR